MKAEDWLLDGLLLVAFQLAGVEYMRAYDSSMCTQGIGEPRDARVPNVWNSRQYDRKIDASGLGHGVEVMDSSMIVM